MKYYNIIPAVGTLGNMDCCFCCIAEGHAIILL